MKDSSFIKAWGTLHKIKTLWNLPLRPLWSPPCLNGRHEAGLMWGRLNSLPSSATGLSCANANTQSCCAWFSTFLSHLAYSWSAFSVSGGIVSNFNYKFTLTVLNLILTLGHFTFSSWNSEFSESSCKRHMMWSPVFFVQIWVQMGQSGDDLDCSWKQSGGLLRERNVLVKRQKSGEEHEPITVNSCNSTWLFPYL